MMLAIPSELLCIRSMASCLIFRVPFRDRSLAHPVGEESELGLSGEHLTAHCPQWYPRPQGSLHAAEVEDYNVPIPPELQPMFIDFMLAVAPHV